MQKAILGECQHERWLSRREIGSGGRYEDPIKITIGVGMHISVGTRQLPLPNNPVDMNDK